MNIKGFEHDIRIKVEFTGPELAVIWRCSREHYDGTCIAASSSDTRDQQAFLKRGINYSVNMGEALKPNGKQFPTGGWCPKDIPKMSKVTIVLSTYQLQIINKCLESLSLMNDATDADLALAWELKNETQRALLKEFTRISEAP